MADARTCDEVATLTNSLLKSCMMIYRREINNGARRLTIPFHRSGASFDQLIATNCSRKTGIRCHIYSDMKTLTATRWVWTGSSQFPAFT
jgi:hypothetical protein